MVKNAWNVGAFHELLLHLLTRLQLMTKILKLVPPAPLFNVGCKFDWSFLTTTAWYSFSILGTTLNQGGGEILGIFEQA